MAASTQYVASTAQLVVEIFVRDIANSKAFYQELGFELEEDKGNFIGLTWEGHQLYLDERPDLPEAPEHPQANVRIMVPDVDIYWRKTQEMGARVLVPIEDREYGLRDFTILDPDGVGLRFGSRID